MLYDRYENEEKFRDQFVRPLLNRMGFYGVRETHGSAEFGRDFVFSELHRLGGMRHYAAQVKHEKKINQGHGVDQLLTQIKQAFAKPHRVPESPRDCYVSAVYIFNSGEITDNAKEQMLADLGRERYGDNVHFLEGQRLLALGEWATYRSDQEVRARLTGLLGQMQLNLAVLEGYAASQPDGLLEGRGFVLHGIEQYMSSPIDAPKIPLNEFHTFWQHARIIESCQGVIYRNASQVARDGDFQTMHILVPIAKGNAIAIINGILGTLAQFQPLV